MKAPCSNEIMSYQGLSKTLRQVFADRGVRGMALITAEDFFSCTAQLKRAVHRNLTARGGEGDFDKRVLIECYREIDKLESLVDQSCPKLLGRYWVDKQACLNQIDRVLEVVAEQGVQVENDKRVATGAEAIRAGSRLPGWRKAIYEFCEVFGAGILICAWLGVLQIAAQNLGAGLAYSLGGTIALSYAAKALAESSQSRRNEAGKIILALVGCAGLVGVIGVVFWGVFFL